jgi:hypothetical protein
MQLMMSGVIFISSAFNRYFPVISIWEAAKHDKNNLAYIEGICKKRKEKESIN